MEWSSGKYPEKLVVAMKNFSTVFSAWHEDELVGLVCAMDDGIMNAYIHYILVKPKHQLKGVGRELLERVKSHYKDYLKIVVVTEQSISRFYEYSGFEKKDGKCVLFISDLED